MTKTKTKPAKTGATAAVDPMTAVNPFPASALQEIMTENTLFMTNRMQHLMDTQASLLACKHPLEWIGIQSEFHKTRMEQYADQMTRLYHLMTETAENAIEATRAFNSRAYNDVPL